MVATRPLPLPSAPANADQPVVCKSGTAVRRIEPAGFTFFLTREWQLDLAYHDVFEPRHLASVAADALAGAERYLGSVCLEGSDALYAFGPKRQWAHLLAAGKRPSLSSDRSDSGSDDFVHASKGSSKKCLGLVRDFVAKGQNAYELLNVRDSDDIAKIKASYKRIVLLLHPDKAVNTRVPDDLAQYAAKYKLRNLCDEERSQQFILIQDAFTIMSDPCLRHEYDCSLPFDETIPSKEEVKAASDFFALFVPLFEMNARWSHTKPVPSLGDASSSDEAVDEFYDFWRGFETTRTFSHAVPHVLDDAESREEKRWMERENLKVQRKLIKKELVRIQKLVDIAQASDPRLKAIAERRRLQKLERQRQLEEQRLREQRERAEAEARQRDELERSQNRERFEKQIVKKFRQHIRGIGGKLPNGAALSQNFDRLSELDYSFVKESCQGIYSLLGHAADLEGSDESLQFVKRMDSVVKSAVLEDAAPFEDIIQRVASRITPAPEEPAPAAPETRQEAAAEAAPVEWSPEELSRLSKGVELHVAGVSGRWSLIAKHVKTKTAAQCIQMAREMAAGKHVGTTGASVNIANGVHGDLWTPEQQSEFEAALAKYPATLDPATRWRMIASEVQSKTPKECLSRFKMIKATIAAAAAATRN